jgi:hypothetical protein
MSILLDDMSMDVVRDPCPINHSRTIACEQRSNSSRNENKAAKIEGKLPSRQPVATAFPHIHKYQCSVISITAKKKSLWLLNNE